MGIINIMAVLKVLLVIITLPLRAAGIVLAGALKLVGKFIAVICAVVGMVTTIIGVIGILASAAVIVMHICGQIDFEGFWFTAGSGLFAGFFFVMIGQLGESIGEWIDSLGSMLFELCIS